MSVQDKRDLISWARFKDSSLLKEAQLLADSINNYSQYKKTPAFLFDDSLDYKYIEYWTSFHNPVSIRMLILENVSDQSELFLVIKQLNLNSKKSRNKKSIIPFSEYSFSELMRFKLELIRQRNNLPVTGQ